jgi:hypothetical protein
VVPTPQQSPERTPSPIVFPPRPPSTIESYTSTHVATEGALSDTATIRDPSIFEDPQFQIAAPPRNLVETLVQAIYFVPEFQRELEIQFGPHRPIYGTEFTVSDLRLFADEIIPVLSAPPSPAASLIVLNSGEEGQTESSSSQRSSTSV